MSERKKTLWINLAALALLGALLVSVYLWGGGHASEFGGTDALVTEMLEEDGVKPWFRPLITLGSSELESGLFALQAGIGGAVFGYAVGALRNRRKPTPSEQT